MFIDLTMIMNILITQLLILITNAIEAQSRLEISAAPQETMMPASSQQKSAKIESSTRHLFSNDERDVIPFNFWLQLSSTLNSEQEDLIKRELGIFLENINLTILLEEVRVIDLVYLVQNPSFTVVNANGHVTLYENSEFSPILPDSLQSIVIDKITASQGLFNQQISDILPTLAVIFGDINTFDITPEHASYTIQETESMISEDVQGSTASPEAIETPPEVIKTSPEGGESSVEVSKIQQPLSSTQNTSVVLGILSAAGIFGVVVSTVVVLRKRREQKDSTFEICHDEEAHHHEEAYHHEEAHIDEYKIEVSTDISGMHEIYMNNIEMALCPKDVIT